METTEDYFGQLSPSSATESTSDPWTDDFFSSPSFFQKEASSIRKSSPTKRQMGIECPGFPAYGFQGPSPYDLSNGHGSCELDTSWTSSKFSPFGSGDSLASPGKKSAKERRRERSVPSSGECSGTEHSRNSQDSGRRARGQKAPTAARRRQSLQAGSKEIDYDPNAMINHCTQQEIVFQPREEDEATPPRARRSSLTRRSSDSHLGRQFMRRATMDSATTDTFGSGRQRGVNREKSTDSRVGRSPTKKSTAERRSSMGSNIRQRRPGVARHSSSQRLQRIDYGKQDVGPTSATIPENTPPEQMPKLVDYADNGWNSSFNADPWAEEEGFNPQPPKPRTELASSNPAVAAAASKLDTRSGQKKRRESRRGSCSFQPTNRLRRNSTRTGSTTKHRPANQSSAEKTTREIDYIPSSPVKRAIKNPTQPYFDSPQRVSRSGMTPPQTPSGMSLKSSGSSTITGTTAASTYVSDSSWLSMSQDDEQHASERRRQQRRSPLDSLEHGNTPNLPKVAGSNRRSSMGSRVNTQAKANGSSPRKMNRRLSHSSGSPLKTMTSKSRNDQQLRW